MSEELEQKDTGEPSQMEALLDDQDVLTYSRGDILRGRVVQVNDQGVLVDIGYKSEALMRLTELAPFHKAQLQPDDEIEVLITYIDEEEGTIHVSEKAALYEKRISELERAYRQRLPIMGTIEDEVRDAGYHVNLLRSGIRAFLPGSHLGEDLAPHIEGLRGKEVPFIILELDRRERNLVVSHREYLKELERRRKDELFSKLEVGQIIEGTIKSIVDFGLFVDIGGFEGLVHRSEISWKDIPVPPNTYKVGDKATVKILGLDRSKERISLSIKQLRPDPWIGLKERYPSGAKTTGTVVSLTDFGAFVRIEEDVEGLVHISELSWGYPEHPKEVVKVGQQVEVVVLDVNGHERRVSLSMKRVQSDPWEKIEEKYPEGMVVQGTVTKLTDFGAFVHLEDGVEALLHISEMSWDKVNKPGDVVQESQEITAKVIKSDAGKRKIRLSLKELQEDPWHKFLESYSVGSLVEGPVTELKDFGAFMKITDDVEGLIHVSEITEERISTPADVLHVGQTVKARIIGINEEKRQVRLSMRNVHKQQERLLTSEDSGHEAVTMGQRVKGLKELKERLGA
jgi:small subunit ribosomal protein S1